MYYADGQYKNCNLRRIDLGRLGAEPELVHEYMELIKDSKIYALH